MSQTTPSADPRSARDWTVIAVLGLANVLCFALALFLLFRFLREWA